MAWRRVAARAADPVNAATAIVRTSARVKPTMVDLEGDAPARRASRSTCSW